MSPPRTTDVSFLGGRDLEMRTIRELPMARGAESYDGGLSWGANASDDAAEIDAAGNAGQQPVLRNWSKTTTLLAQPESLLAADFE